MSLNRFESWLFGKWGKPVKALALRLADIVWPESALCCACGRFTAGEPLCSPCRQALRDDGFLWAWHRTELAPDLTAWSLRPHEGVARSLVLRLKFNAEARAAELLADLVLPLPEGVSFPPDTVVTWVTMPESRLRERGIDHGRALAEAVARRLNLPCRRLLLRNDGREKRQATLNAAQRAANLQGAFRPETAVRFPVLLVDDVRTTGTTLLRCAEALRSGGADRIYALTATFADR